MFEYHAKHLDMFARRVKLEGKSILEIGGCLSQSQGALSDPVPGIDRNKLDVLEMLYPGKGPFDRSGVMMILTA